MERLCAVFDPRKVLRGEGVRDGLRSSPHLLAHALSARRLESRIGVVAGVLVVLFLACSVPALRAPVSGGISRQALHATSAGSSQRAASGLRATPVQAAPPAPAAPPAVPLYATDWLSAHPGPDLGLHGQAVVLLDVDRHEVRWQRDPSTPRAPASLTKIVTAMVAADLAPLDQKITVSANSDMRAVQRVEPASTVMGLTAGEVLTERELMYGLFMRSGNDAAETLAGGIVDRDRFMALMNQKAVDLGMKSSHFTSPVGLDDPGMRSSAYDLAVAGATIVNRYPDLLAISGTPQVSIPQTATHKPYAMENYNKLLLPGPFAYPGATGMKTAFTDDAGPCMVATASRGGRRLVAVVLHSNDFFGDATKVLNYGFALPS
jgi:serine-type D-Ala-D-Ala carboxypeptidase (penicillin-binding protein 5/6)